MLTNFYPIKITFEDYDIWRIPFKEGRLDKLRELYNSTHSFFRHENFIYCSNMEGDEIRGGQFHRAKTFEDEKITTSLIKHIFFRTFRKQFDVIPLQFYPFLIQSRNKTDDLIRHLLPNELQDRIAFKKQIEVQLRLIETFEGPQFGFVINLPRKWVFDIDCEELANEGFNLIEMDVLHSMPLPGLKHVLAPDATLVGRIVSIEDQWASIETNEGLQSYPLVELLPHKTTRNISSYLSFKLGAGQAADIVEYVNESKETIYNTKHIQTEIQQFARRISLTAAPERALIDYVNKDGFYFTICSDSQVKGKSYTFKNPSFVFDAARTKVSTQADFGLSDYGPYDSDLFSPKDLKVLAICKKANRGFFTQQLNALFDGIPTSRYFKKGLRRKYEFQSIQPTIEEVSEFRFEEYDKIISHLDEKPDIAFIEIPASFRQYRIEDNPYYLIKARLLTKDIPVQFITTEVLKTANEYVLNQVALQMYAKLGGIPWVLSSAQSVDREIVVGIGNSFIYDNAYVGNNQERVVGITTFFSGDGQYLLSDRAKDVPYDEYFDELLKSLKGSFNELQKQQGWRVGDTIRLIFHIFKPIKNTEFDVVSNLIRDYNDYKIQFAFVTISKQHPFLLFDPTQEGRKDNWTKKTVGQYVPLRGTNIVLDSSSCLVQMLGTKEMKTGKHGSSNPLLIKIRKPEGKADFQDIEELLFTDLHYVVQQLYQFTYLSWRTFMSNESPATLLYSTLLSDLLGKLRRISFWHPDTVNTSLKRKKWFL